MQELHRSGKAHGFERIIAPMTPEIFFAEYFEKKHLVIRREDRAYYRDLLSIDDIDRALTTMVFDIDDLQMVNTGRPVPSDDYALPSGAVDAVRVTHHFSQGATIILPGLHRKLPKLAAYCRALETVFSCDLQTNIYLTPDNAQGFKTHYDSHDVIVLQTHGTKTWRIYDSPMVLPLRSQAFRPEGFVAGNVIDEFVLRAGDMAYVPRGVVHDAIATDEVSLHITTGLLHQRWIDVLVDTLVQYAHDDPALRASIPAGFANAGADLQSMGQLLARHLNEAAAAIDPVAAMTRQANEFRTRRLPVVPGHFAQFAAADLIAEGTKVGLRDNLIWAIATVGDEVVLSVYEGEIAFPAYVEGALRAILGGAGFTVGALDCDLDAEGQAVLARRLVREGVLYRVD